MMAATAIRNSQLLLKHFWQIKYSTHSHDKKNAHARTCARAHTNTPTPTHPPTHTHTHTHTRARAKQSKAKQTKISFIHHNRGIGECQHMDFVDTMVTGLKN